MNNRRRVVITGMGAITAQGADEATIWKAMLAGRTGIRRIASFDLDGYRCQSGAEIDKEALAALLAARKIKPRDRTVDMALHASGVALEQAGLIPKEPPYDPLNAAVLIGTGGGSSESVYIGFSSFAKKGIRGVRPTTVPRCMANATAAQVSLHYRLTGTNYVITCACSSSTTAIGIGFRMIGDGYIDTVLCGGSDTVFNPILYSAWNNLGVASRNPDPERACRPFDVDRDGCVLGEGAGSLVLESLDKALARGAPIRAEVCGFGESSDASHLTAPSPEGQAKAMLAALDSAAMTPKDIGFINTHGTATKANDECEAKSIRMVFGAMTDRLPAASNKSYFGHLLGASGAVEVIVSVLGFENRKVPPNLNLVNQDPKCDLCLVGSQPMELSSPVVLKNSFGFGGTNSVLILKRWE